MSRFREPPPDSPFGRKMRALRLRHQEVHWHDDLMDTPLVHWPESLQERVRLVAEDQGMCGDVMAEAVARWIRPIDKEDA